MVLDMRRSSSTRSATPDAAVVRAQLVVNGGIAGDPSNVCFSSSRLSPPIEVA